jgi:hypothetical protein
VVACTRGSQVLVRLYREVFRGILCCDRWVVYLTYHSGRMQLCWAHLKRNILGIADYARRASARQSCRDALTIVARLFRLWHCFRGDLRDRRGNRQPLDRQQLVEKSTPLQKSYSPFRRPTWTTPIARPYHAPGPNVLDAHFSTCYTGQEYKPASQETHGTGFRDS